MVGHLRVSDRAVGQASGAVPLDPVAQQLDFSLGAFVSGALEREPPGAAEQIVGLLGADGLPYRRGGSRYLSNAAVGSSGLLWVADARLVGGQRTIFQKAGAMDWHILGLDDATPVALGATLTGAQQPFRPPVLNGVMHLAQSGAPASYGRWYAGSRKTSVYSTGTAWVTQDSRIVTGVGTSWLANADAGMFLFINSVRGLAAVASVDSNTQLTLAAPWVRPSVAAPGVAYELQPFASNLESTPTALAFDPPPLTSVQASIAGRLILAGGASIYFSESDTFRFMDTTNMHQFSGAVLGLAVLRDVLLVFTSAGVYAVSGMAYPLVDPGTGDPLQRVELVNQDLIAWAHEGIAPWQGALVVPALDGVYLMDSLGAPQRISDRIEDLYLGYVRAGYVPGVAEVYNGHYFLPVLNGTTWVDTLVCRLQPSHSGNNFAWTQLAGQGAEVSAFAERQTVPPLLLAASRKTTSRVLDNSAFFKPAAAVKNDADGTAPGFTVTTIDYPTGNMVSNFVHHVRLMYELTDAASDLPMIAAEVSIDGAAFVSLDPTASDGFSSNTIANYTADAGVTSNVSITGGVMDAAANFSTQNDLILTSGTFTDFGDCVVTAKVTLGTTRTNFLGGVLLKRVAPASRLAVYVTDDGAASTLNISNPSLVLSSTALSRISASTSYWVRVRIVGNVVTAEFFTGDPASNAAATTATYTLTGSNATTYGSGVMGKTGLVFQPQQTAANLDDFSVVAAGAVAGVGERKWRVNRHAKNVRFRFTVSGASASCKIKSVEVFVRHSGRP